MLSKCVNCGNTTYEPADGIYVGYERCAECKFLTNRKVPKAVNVHVPEDPGDAMLCEGCQ